MGLLFAADFAGSIPKTSPIITAIPKEIIMELNDKIVSIPDVNSMVYAPSIPSIIPSIPPPTLISTDSDRNCKITSSFVAPIARMMPIFFLTFYLKC